MGCEVRRSSLMRLTQAGPAWCEDTDTQRFSGALGGTFVRATHDLGGLFDARPRGLLWRSSANGFLAVEESALPFPRSFPARRDGEGL